MAGHASATVRIDKDGRLTTPQSTREALEIEEQSTHLDLNIRVLERDLE